MSNKNLFEIIEKNGNCYICPNAPRISLKCIDLTYPISDFKLEKTTKTYSQLKTNIFNNKIHAFEEDSSSEELYINNSDCYNFSSSKNKEDFKPLEFNVKNTKILSNIAKKKFSKLNQQNVSKSYHSNDNFIIVNNSNDMIAEDHLNKKIPKKNISKIFSFNSLNSKKSSIDESNNFSSTNIME